MLIWIYETACDNVWVLAITCVFFLLSKLYFRRRFSEIQDSMKEQNTNIIDDANFEKCQSASCVRCRTSKEILTRARTRLSYQAYPDSRGTENHENNLQKLHIDLENSLHKRTRHVDGFDQNPTVFKMSGLEAKPWWDINETEEFKDLCLDDNLIVDIKNEFFELMKTSDTEENVNSLWKVNSTPTGMWSICHLMDQGRATKAIKQCPGTWNAIQNHFRSLLKSNLFGNVAFSVIVPGTKITSHYGPTNIRLRCHIGLMVPQGCFLAVNGEERSYKEGEILLFDDSFSHSVEHRGQREEGMRAVLMVDIWHPHIDDELRHAYNDHSVKIHRKRVRYGPVSNAIFTLQPLRLYTPQEVENE